MRSCEEYAEIISRLIDAEVSAGEAEEVQLHIENCESCRALFLAFSSVSDFLDNELEEPPAELSENIMADIRRTKLASVKTSNAMRRNIITAFASVAALAVICYTVPALSGFGSKTAGVALSNESAAVNAVYESAAQDEGSGMLIPEAPVMFSDSARFAAPAGASENGAFDSAAQSLSGDSAEKLASLISSAEPCAEGTLPEDYISIYNVFIEEYGKEYTLYCTGDSTFVRDPEGSLAVIHDCGERVIGSIIG